MPRDHDGPGADRPGGRPQENRGPADRQAPAARPSGVAPSGGVPSGNGSPDAHPPGDRPTTTAHAESERATLALPGWFEVGLLFVVSVVVWCGGIGLALAVAGRYTVAVSTGVGLAAAIGSTAVGARALRGREGDRADRTGGTRPAVVAVLLALADAAWNVWRSGSWVNADRDPGAYALAARWISDHGNLRVPFESTWGTIGLPVTGSSSALYVEGDHLEFQFDHLLPALLAQVRDLAGDRAMLSANAVVVALGLLAVYAVGVRLTGRPWVVLLATSGLALSLPVLYVARASFSEGVTMLLVWAGVWLLVAAWDRAPVVLGLIGGAVLGAATMARVDSLVYLLMLPLLAGAVAVARADGPERRRVTTIAVCALLGAVAPVVVGTVDVVTRSGQYYSSLTAQIRPLQLATVATVVIGTVALGAAGPIARATQRFRGVLTRRRDRLGRIAALVVVAVFVLAWTVRPLVDRPTGAPNETVRELQRLAHLPSQPGRLYAEQTMVWMSWYLGPVTVALAVLGLGVLVLAAWRGRSAALVVFAVAGIGTVLYLYRPFNTPDQLFGVRRYVPATMPLFALAVASALAAVPRRAPARLRAAAARRWRTWWRPVAALVVIGVLAFPIGVGWPVRDFSQRRGALAMFDATCAALGPDAAVLFPGDSYARTSYPQVLRDFCEIPVAAATGPLTLAGLRHAADTWRAAGRTLWLVDSDTRLITQLLGTDAALPALAHDLNPHELGSTLTRPATSYLPWDESVYGVPVPG